MFRFTKARSPDETLSDLENFLRGNSDEPIEFLSRMVDDWRKISYDEIETAIAAGKIDELIDWQSRYAKVVNEKFSPLWLLAIQTAASKATRGRITIDDSDFRVKDFLRTRGAELVTLLSDESKRAIAAIILHGQANMIPPKKIAQQIRPLIGLNARQAQANANYRERIFNRLVEQGLPANAANSRADKAALKYASKQHRQRAETIVHTELARAYNQGAHEGILAAQRAGLMGVCEMVWSTAGTNRVCGRCLALKDTVVGHTNESGVTLPPLHPRCRCTIIYRETTNKPKDNPPAPKNPLTAPATSGNVQPTPPTVSPLTAPRDAKAEMERLRQTLATQRTRGATAAEIEATIKAGGKLVAEKVKATKIFDLPSSQKIDYNLLANTYTAFMQRIIRIRGKIPNREYAELYNIWLKTKSEFSQYKTEATKISEVIQKSRAEQLKTILAEFRPMGATEKQLKAQFTKGSNADISEIVKTTLNYYPSDWVAASVKRGTFKTEFRERGGYNDSLCTLFMNPQKIDKIATAVHELAHRMEQTSREILAAETAFYSRRTAGESLEKLSILTGNPNYKDYERTRKDKFLDVYMGRDYGGRSYELTSMGFQYAYTDPAKLLQDKDMAEWIYGLLCLI